MELERLSVQLRPRGGWEALDLGCQMARSWWRPVWGVWFAVYLPAAIAAARGLPASSPGWRSWRCGG